MGMGAEVGEDGAECKEIGWLARGGGSLESRRGARGSSYRGELFSLTLFLRELCRSVEEGRVAGKVSHWTDNETIVKVIRRFRSMRRDQWRKRQSRDLWAEVRGRINFWLQKGGEWMTNWVKGHVDSDSNRAVESWTGAERQNMMADALATYHLNLAVRRVAALPASNWTLGEGRWTSVGPGPLRGVQWWDATDRHWRQHASVQAGYRYWKKREGKRQGAAGAEIPAVDTRLARSGDERRGGSKWDIFRCKLWWDHLPSQAVRRRGQQESGEGQTPNKCDHCQRPCEGTTWHVIAECGNAELVTAREQGRERITQTLDDIERARGPTRTTSVWREAFSMADGKWVAPPEWRDELTKAGEVFNPWYGLFPPHWLDDRWQEKGDGHSHWTGAVSELRKLGQTALEA